MTLDDLVWRGDAGRPIRFRLWFDEDDPNGDPGHALELRKGRAGWSVTSETIRIAGKCIEVGEDDTFEHPSERMGTQRYSVPMHGTLRYMVNRFTGDEKAREAIDPILENSKRLGEAWRYRPSAFDIGSFMPTEPPASRSRVRRFPVFTNGRGLAPALQDLQGRQRDVFEHIENKVHNLFDHIKSIGFEAGPEGLRLSFMTSRSNSLVPAPQEADGVLLATFLCWRLYTAEQPMIIWLEEPENGFYPDLLQARYDLLRSFTDSEDDAARAQILVSTHSIEFLRVLRAHHSEFRMVRAVEFGGSDGAKVESLSHYRDAANFIEHVQAGDSVLPSKWQRK